MRDINVAFSRHLLSIVLRDLAKVTSVAERKDAYVYDSYGDNWEFHGPDNFYWHGIADNAYDAKVNGWQAWWAELEKDAAAVRARTLGNEHRQQISRNRHENTK